MGRRDRERIARIRAGLEDPIVRQRVTESSYKGVVKELSKGGVDEQVNKLNTLVGEGVLPQDKLRRTLVANAPKEMDKAIGALIKKKKPITVDILTAEVRTTPGFLDTCERVGLNLEWFERLARDRMLAHGIAVQ